MLIGRMRPHPVSCTIHVFICQLKGSCRNYCLGRVNHQANKGNYGQTRLWTLTTESFHGVFLYFWEYLSMEYRTFLPTDIQLFLKDIPPHCVNNRRGYNRQEKFVSNTILKTFIRFCDFILKKFPFFLDVLLYIIFQQSRESINLITLV